MKFAVCFLIFAVMLLNLNSCASGATESKKIILASQFEKKNWQVRNSQIRGADISYLDELESLGIKFYENGIEKDLLSILKDNDINWIRLRIWNDPENAGHGKWCSLERTILMAKRVKKAGFKLLLDFHYSDWWADPGQQNIPAAWKGHSLEQLCTDVYGYTELVLQALKKAECVPDMVQVGNEITNGMLWPAGATTDGNMQNLMKLVNAGCSAVRKSIPESKIMLHLDKGSYNSFCVWWFGEAEKWKVDYDVIGLSYYPFWQDNDLTALENNLSSLKKQFSKEVCVAETAYPWTFDAQDDRENHVKRGASLIQGCPATIAGQNAFIEKLSETIEKSEGLGWFWWEPDGVSDEFYKSDWENLTWFDFEHNWILK